MLELSAQQKRDLKARAHHLKPVVLLGNKGLTEAVFKEIDIALESHGLIKVKMTGVERDERKQTATTICEQLQAGLVNIIGSVLIMYRKPKDTAKTSTNRQR